MRIQYSLAALAAIAALSACSAGARQSLAPAPQPNAYWTNQTGRASSAATNTGQLQVYGTWHCGDQYCSWPTAITNTSPGSTFDNQNRWIIDRNMNGTYVPSVNLVVLAFVDPLKLMNLTNDSSDTSGIPNGMTSAVVSYFTSHNVRVMLSIGGQTYTGNWDSALSSNPTQLGINAASAAKRLGVGIEIDYENTSSPNLTGMQSFVSAYRSQIAYDASGANPAARFTIDLGAGDQYLTQISNYAGQHWLQVSNPVLDYANAMVPNKQVSASSYESDWSQHVNGYNGVPPLAPARLTGSIYIVDSNTVIPECNNFSSSLENSTGSYVLTVPPAGAGTTSGMLGYMFWSSGAPSTRHVTTFPPNTCQGGVGTGASTYNIPLPMPALRQS